MSERTNYGAIAEEIDYTKLDKIWREGHGLTIDKIAVSASIVAALLLFAPALTPAS